MWCALMGQDWVSVPLQPNRNCMRTGGGANVGRKTETLLRKEAAVQSRQNQISAPGYTSESIAKQRGCQSCAEKRTMAKVDGAQLFHA